MVSSHREQSEAIQTWGRQLRLNLDCFGVARNDGRCAPWLADSLISGTFDERERIAIYSVIRFWRPIPARFSRTFINVSLMCYSTPLLCRKWASRKIHGQIYGYQIEKGFSP